MVAVVVVVVVSVVVVVVVVVVLRLCVVMGYLEVVCGDGLP